MASTRVVYSFRRVASLFITRLKANLHIAETGQLIRLGHPCFHPAHVEWHYSRLCVAVCAWVCGWALQSASELASDVLPLFVQKDGEVPPDNLYRLTVQLLKVLRAQCVICTTTMCDCSVTE